jgi:hypothetical protein
MWYRSPGSNSEPWGKRRRGLHRILHGGSAHPASYDGGTDEQAIDKLITEKFGEAQILRRAPQDARAIELLQLKRNGRPSREGAEPSPEDSRGINLMKLVFAIAMIVMLTVSAFAQGLSGKGAPGPSPGPPPKSPQEIQAERAAEQAYKNSLRNIPDQPPADPWGNARSLTATKTTQAKKPPTKADSPPKRLRAALSASDRGP